MGIIPGLIPGSGVETPGHRNRRSRPCPTTRVPEGDSLVSRNPRCGQVQSSGKVGSIEPQPHRGGETTGEQVQPQLRIPPSADPRRAFVRDYHPRQTLELALYYLDTSALIKLYVREPGTDRLRSLFRAREGRQFGVLSIAIVELRSGLRRRIRSGDTNAVAVEQVLASFASDLDTRLVGQGVTEPLVGPANRVIDGDPPRVFRLSV